MLTLKRCSGDEVVIDDHSRFTIVDATADRVTLKVTTSFNVCIQRVIAHDLLDCEALLVPTADTVVP